MNLLIWSFIFVLTVTVGETASIKENDKKIFLGEYINGSTGLGTIRMDHQTIPRTDRFYVSQNSASFAAAEEDCKKQLGGGATLACIETQDEIDELVSILNRFDTGHTYWVGGLYNEAINNFVWITGIPFGSWIPWNTHMPDSKLDFTRVSLSSKSESIKLNTEFKTVTNRYICELPANPCSSCP